VRSFLGRYTRLGLQNPSTSDDDHEQVCKLRSAIQGRRVGEWHGKHDAVNDRRRPCGRACCVDLPTGRWTERLALRSEESLSSPASTAAVPRPGKEVLVSHRATLVEALVPERLDPRMLAVAGVDAATTQLLAHSARSPL
jgi:hypothetical protein